MDIGVSEARLRLDIRDEVARRFGGSMQEGENLSLRRYTFIERVEPPASSLRAPPRYVSLLRARTRCAGS